MFSKPCAPKVCERDGCTTVITSNQPWQLKHRRFCSRSCAARFRMAHGWRPWTVLLQPDVRARAFAALAPVNKQMAERQRHRRAARVVRRLEGLLTPRFADELTRDQLALVKALLARAYTVGRADEYQRGWNARHPRRGKATTAGRTAA